MLSQKHGGHPPFRRGRIFLHLQQEIETSISQAFPAVYLWQSLYLWFTILKGHSKHSKVIRWEAYSTTRVGAGLVVALALTGGLAVAAARTFPVGCVAFTVVGFGTQIWPCLFRWSVVFARRLNEISGSAKRPSATSARLSASLQS